MRFAIERIYSTVVEAESVDEAHDIAHDMPLSEFEITWVQSAALDQE